MFELTVIDIVSSVEEMSPDQLINLFPLSEEAVIEIC